jgi:diphthamide biosynthesis protein 2
VTPYELEIALQAEQSWTGRYVLDFERLLADASEKLSNPCDLHHPNDESLETEQETDEDSDQPVFSLISGTYRQAKRYGNGKEQNHGVTPQDGSSTVVLRNQNNTVAQVATDSAAGQFLQQRTYKGLELRLGEDAPSVLEQGRRGIARGYQDDLEHQDI